MAYDGLMVSFIAKELRDKLIGAKIDKISQPESDQIVMNLRVGTERPKLLIDFSSHGSRTTLTNLEFENPQDAPAFCMLLRKHIQGGRIIDVNQLGTDRILVFDIETINELGYEVSKKLIAENMGKSSNLILVDAISGKIIDSAKHVFTDERQILAGIVYEKPASLRLTNGFGYGPSTKIALDSGADINALRPSIWLDETGKPKDFHLIDLVQYSGVYKRLEFDTLSEALDYYYSNRIESNHLLQKKQNFEKQIKALSDKNLKKLAKLDEEIRKSEQAEEYRIKGELINANIASIKPGSKYVDLISYYDGEMIHVELDERLSPAKNGQAYFKKYSKLKSSRKEKLAQKAECEQTIEYLTSVCDMIEIAESYAQLDLIRTELYEQGFIRINKSDKRKQKAKLEPRKLKTISGRTLIVGNSNTENDYVTFKLAKKGDYWLHTKDIHGAHVILGMDSQEPSEEDIYSAAAVAAWYSKARFSDKVPVDYVPIKYVKKPSGARPGMVIFTNNRTVWVKPNAKGEER